MQVVVRNVPDMPGHSVPDTVDQFFKTNHPEHYLCHQVKYVLSLNLIPSLSSVGLMNWLFLFQAVYNANKYAKLVKQRQRLQDWYDYYVLKHQRNPHKKPTCRVSLSPRHLFSLSLDHMMLIRLVHVPDRVSWSMG